MLWTLELKNKKISHDRKDFLLCCFGEFLKRNFVVYSSSEFGMEFVYRYRSFSYSMHKECSGNTVVPPLGPGTAGQELGPHSSTATFRQEVSGEYLLQGIILFSNSQNLFLYFEMHCAII
jgi:hypothetical protein